eukprot:6018356-Amphidinium_carterae.1
MAPNNLASNLRGINFIVAHQCFISHTADTFCGQNNNLDVAAAPALCSCRCNSPLSAQESQEAGMNATGRGTILLRSPLKRASFATPVEISHAGQRTHETCTTSASSGNEGARKNHDGIGPFIVDCRPESHQLFGATSPISLASSFKALLLLLS